MMKCPDCCAPVTSREAPCPACGSLPGLAVEGALAPDPLSSARPAEREPLREIPGRRRRERTWKDEVRERVAQRRRQRGTAPTLPLFPEPEPDRQATSAEPEQSPLRPAEPPPPRPSAAVRSNPSEAVAPLRPQPQPPRDGPPEVSASTVLPGDPEPMLRAGRSQEPRPDGVTARAEEVPDASETGLDEPTEDEWTFELSPAEEPEQEPERPARAIERLRAGLIDLGLLTGLWAAVLFLAARAARVSLSELLSAWPFLLGYLAFLGLAYAACFTGTTGQSIGKIVARITVVDRRGRPPGMTRAMARALVGALGVLLVGVGLVPILLDPARRAAHDRLLGTRVVHY